jgi:hypothetical protein
VNDLKDRPVTRDTLETAARGYKQPVVNVGDIVWYYHDCNWRVTTPALVTFVDPRTIALLAFTKDGAVLTMPHVRHRTDPALTNPDVHGDGDGAWEHREWPREEASDAVLRGLQDDVDQLKAVVQKLAAQVNNQGSPANKQPKGEKGS